MRVVIADDSVLLREGLSRLLAEAGIETVASVGNGEALEAAVAENQPDLAIIDIRMPPTFTHEGAQAATRLRAAWPQMGILLLSQSIESRYALELARMHPTRFGYLLKDRVLNVGMLVDSVERVASGGTVLDPDIIAHFLDRRAGRERLSELTARERDVLALIAQGRSNAAVARHLVLTEKTVESHIASIFSKRGLLPEPDDHRRVLAVRAWLEP
ncbi:MAG: response regulator transcription factor [Tepidiformaceae bacterium]